MSDLLDSDISEIVRQADVDSRPHRTNYANIKTAVNDNQTQITAIVTPASGSEVVNARNNMASLKDNIELRRGFGKRVVEADDFKVTESNPAADTVDVDAGSGIIAGIGITKASSSTSGSISPSGAGDERIDVVVLQSDNTIVIVSGAEVAANPVFPAIASTQMALAHFTIDDTSPVVVNDADITDDRIQIINPFQDFGDFNKEYTYNANGTIDTIVVTDKEGIEYTFQTAYSSGLLSTIAVTISGNIYTLTFTYTGLEVTDEVIIIT